jgi:hypothetical protein
MKPVHHHRQLRHHQQNSTLTLPAAFLGTHGSVVVHFFKKKCTSTCLASIGRIESDTHDEILVERAKGACSQSPMIRYEKNW